MALAQEDRDLLIEVATNQKEMMKKFDKLPCEKHSTDITKHNERINTHSKFLWGYFTATIGQVSGLVVLAYKTIFK